MLQRVPSVPAYHDGACGVDDIAARLGAGIHQVDGRQQELLLQVRALPDLLLGLVCLQNRTLCVCMAAACHDTEPQGRHAPWLVISSARTGETQAAPVHAVQGQQRCLWPRRLLEEHCNHE